MFRRLEGSAPEILARARTLVGMLFAYDGAQKLLGGFGGTTEGVPAAIVFIAGGIELLGGALIAVGLFTRAASSYDHTATTPLVGGTRAAASLPSAGPNESIVSQ